MARQYAVPGSPEAWFLNETTGKRTEALRGSFVNEATSATSVKQYAVPGGGYVSATPRKQYAIPGAGYLTDTPPIVNTSVAPGGGAIILTGFAPSVDLNAAVAPGVGSIILSGFAPTINSDTVVAPGAGAIVFTGFAPAGASDAAPSTGSMSLTGFAPTPLASVGSNVFFHSVF